MVCHVFVDVIRRPQIAGIGSERCKGKIVIAPLVTYCSSVIKIIINRPDSHSDEKIYCYLVYFAFAQ